MLMKIVLLALAGRTFSLSVEQIKHILPRPDLFPLPGLRGGIAGVFLYDEEPVPMLDPLQFEVLGLQGAPAADFVIVFQSEYGNVGLPVDSAVRIVDAEDGTIQDAEPEDEATPTGSIFYYQNVSYPILEIEALLARLPH